MSKVMPSALLCSSYLFLTVIAYNIILVCFSIAIVIPYTCNCLLTHYFFFQYPEENEYTKVSLVYFSEPL